MSRFVDAGARGQRDRSRLSKTRKSYPSLRERNIGNLERVRVWKNIPGGLRGFGAEVNGWEVSVRFDLTSLLNCSILCASLTRGQKYVSAPEDVFTGASDVQTHPGNPAPTKQSAQPLRF